MEQLPTESIIKDFIDSTKNIKPIYLQEISDAKEILKEIQNKKDVEISSVDIKDFYFTINKIKFLVKILRPLNSNDIILPAIIYFHGGGWSLGDYQVYQRFINELVINTGFAVVFVEYTLIPEARYPIPLDQAYFTTKYIIENGKNFNIDGSRVIVMGDSTGGNIAIGVTLLANYFSSPKIIAQVLLYPVTNLHFNNESYINYTDCPWLNKESIHKIRDSYIDSEFTSEILVSPLLATKKDLIGLPRCLIVTAELDILHDDGEAYAHKLIKANVPVVSQRYIGAIHDFLILNAISDSLVSKSAMTNIYSFIKTAVNY